MIGPDEGKCKSNGKVGYGSGAAPPYSEKHRAGVYLRIDLNATPALCGPENFLHPVLLTI